MLVKMNRCEDVLGSSFYAAQKIARQQVTSQVSHLGLVVVGTEISNLNTPPIHRLRLLRGVTL